MSPRPASPGHPLVLGQPGGRRAGSLCSTWSPRPRSGVETVDANALATQVHATAARPRSGSTRPPHGRMRDEKAPRPGPQVDRSARRPPPIHPILVTLAEPRTRCCVSSPAAGRRACRDGPGATCSCSSTGGWPRCRAAACNSVPRARFDEIPVRERGHGEHDLRRTPSAADQQFGQRRTDSTVSMSAKVRVRTARS